MDKTIITLYQNCSILTMDAVESVAEAMAVLRGKILAIGSEEEVREAIKDYSEQDESNQTSLFQQKDIDLHGACLVPGFIDTHIHPGVYVYFKTQISLLGLKSYADLKNTLQQEDRTRSLGEWIVGIDLMEDFFENPAERRFPDRHVIDNCCPERPVIIIRHDGHICSVNSAALQLIGINRGNVKEKTPPSGEIRIDDTGEPTGIFTETATAYAMDCIPIPSNERLKAACKAMSAELASFGITTCGGILQTDEHGIGGKAGAMELPLTQVLIREGLVEQDFVFYLQTDRPKILARVDKAFQKIDGGEGRFWVGGIKLFVDGSFGARTACMFAPYSDSPEGKTGMLVITEDTLRQLIHETISMGYQVIAHAIGDKANRFLIDAYKETVVDNEQARCRVEHASTLTRDTLEDAANHHIILACQPNFINSEYTWLDKRLGSDRLQYTYPFKSILDAGIVLAGASDGPVESANVMQAIYACVTRRSLAPAQAISVTQALHMFTSNAAYALRQEKVKGSLEKGKFADFVVLGKDPRFIPPEDLPAIPVLATYHRGVNIFTKNGL